MAEVRIPSPLRSYTSEKSVVAVQGDTLGGILKNLDAAHPGIRFRMIDEQGRIRQHIRFYVNTDPETSMDRVVKKDDVVHIICALSGG